MKSFNKVKDNLKNFNTWFDSLSKEEKEEYWSEYQADVYVF